MMIFSETIAKNFDNGRNQIVVTDKYLMINGYKIEISTASGGRWEEFKVVNVSYAGKSVFSIEYQTDTDTSLTSNA